MPSAAIKLIRFYELAALLIAKRRQVKPDDHSEVVPLLPIPNRTVKRLCADDSAGSRVKVGHRQALIAPNPLSLQRTGGFCVWAGEMRPTLRPISEVRLARKHWPHYFSFF